MNQIENNNNSNNVSTVDSIIASKTDFPATPTISDSSNLLLYSAASRQNNDNNRSSSSDQENTTTTTTNTNHMINLKPEAHQKINCISNTNANNNGNGHGNGNNSNEDLMERTKAQIMAHPSYPNLVTAYLNCRKVYMHIHTHMQEIYNSPEIRQILT